MVQVKHHHIYSWYLNAAVKKQMADTLEAKMPSIS